MAANVKVALAGATGNLGPAVLRELLKASIPVIVLARQQSSASSSLPAHPNYTIKLVDYSSPTSLEAALQGIQVVISNLSSENMVAQKNLIDASIAAGVSRFIPSEFGSDGSNAKIAALPVYGYKTETRKYLKSKVEANPALSYTFVYNSVFLDWALEHGILLDFKEKKATIYDGGDTLFSVTRLSTVGKALVGVSRHLDETKNRAIFVHDAAMTQNKLLSMAKKISGSDDWKITPALVSDLERECHAELAKGAKGDIHHAMLELTTVGLLGEGFGSDFSDRIDNELLGLPVLSDEEIEEVVRSCATS